MTSKSTLLLISILFVIILFSCKSPIKNWVKIDSKIKEGLHDIEVINQEELIAYSYGTGNIYKSIDGGQEWNVISTLDSLYYEQIQFTNDKTGWIIGSPNKVYKTENGGKNWKPIEINSEANKSLIYGMSFKTQDEGYISLLSNTGSDIYKTENGGKDWSLINSIDGGILNLEWIDNSLYGTGYDIILKNVEKPNNYIEVYRDTTRSSGQMRDIDIGKENKIIGVSFDGNIVKETDEGWTVTNITKNRLRNVLYLGDGKWITTGDNNNEQGNYFESTDDGKTWTQSAEIYPDIHRVVKHKNGMWMVGKEGLIMNKKL